MGSCAALEKMRWVDIYIWDSRLLVLITQSGEALTSRCHVYVDDATANVSMSAAADETYKLLKTDGAWRRTVVENAIKPGSQIGDFDKTVETATDCGCNVSCANKSEANTVIDTVEDFKSMIVKIRRFKRENFAVMQVIAHLIQIVEGIYPPRGIGQDHQNKIKK